MPELPGVAIEQGLIRDYPYGTGASHVLGYVAAVSEKELTGDPLLDDALTRIPNEPARSSQRALVSLAGAVGRLQVALEPDLPDNANVREAIDAFPDEKLE